MVMSINVKSDIRDVTRQLNKVQRKVVPKAAARALNRTNKQVQSASTKELAKETGLKQKDVREKLTIFKAKRTRLVAAVQATGRHLNLIRFGARQTKKGISAKAWGKRKVYKGTFIGNKGRTAFKREGKRRLPIKPVHGPSIPREFVRERVLHAMRTVAGTRWPINFSQDLKFYLSRLR